MMSIYKTLTSISTVLNASSRIYAKRNFASATSHQPQKQLVDHVIADKQYSRRNKHILEMFPLAMTVLKKMYKNLKLNFDSSCKFDNTTVAVGRVKNRQVFYTTITTNWPKQLVFGGYGYKKVEAQMNASIKTLEYLYEENYITPAGHPVTLTEEDKKKIFDEWTRMPEITLPPQVLEKGWSILEKFKEEFHPYSEQENALASSTLSSLQEDFGDERFFDESYEDDGIKDFENSKDFLFNDRPVWNVFTGMMYIAIPNEIHYRSMEMIKKQYELLEFRENAHTQRKTLPMSKYRDDLERALDTHQVVIIAGDTGCGKSTQVPQMILDKWIGEGKGGECNILISQPRRISAISLANYVARERREKLGESVGYHVRMDKQYLKNHGGIMFMTSGMMLQALQVNPTLKGVSHVIVDEIHQRSIDIEMLLIALHRLIRNNQNLKLILMSASLKVDELQEYFKTDGSAFLNVPGALYPLKRHYLESMWGELNISPKNYFLNYGQGPFVYLDLLLDVIKAIDSSRPPGAILCFLPGWQEISTLQRRLQEDQELNDRLWVVPLHSQFSSSHQEQVFMAAPLNMRKVVLSTNIAETSLTVEDVVYVIDTGCEREHGYDSKKDCSVMSNQWISKSSAQQRAGRAGRVQPGEVFHLYPEHIYHSMTRYPTSEIMRISLDDVVLRCKVLCSEESAVTLLSEAMNPPPTNLIQKSIENLVNLGMLRIDSEQSTETLTALGQRAVGLSTSPYLSKALIYSSIFKCVESVSGISSFLDNAHSIFFNSMERRLDIQKAKIKFSSTSDHLAQLRITQQAEKSFSTGSCIEHLLDRRAVQKERGIKRIHLHNLRDIFMVDDYWKSESKWNINSQNSQLVLGVLLAGINQILYLQKGILTKGILQKDKTIFKTLKGDLVKTTRDSVFHKIETNFDSDARHLLCVDLTDDKVTNRLVARDLSLLHPLTVVLFGGHSLLLKEEQGNIVLTIDNQKNVSFLADHSTGRFIKELRHTMNQMIQFILETRGLYTTLADFDSLFDELVQYVSILLEDKEINRVDEMPKIRVVERPRANLE